MRGGDDGPGLSETRGGESGGSPGTGSEIGEGEVAGSPGPQDEVFYCDLCGNLMLNLHCKLICERCGYKRDCSDP